MPSPDCADGESLYSATNNSRWIALAVPRGREPEGGWPVVLVFDFMNRMGLQWGWHADATGGLRELGENVVNDRDPRFFLMYLLLHMLIDRGHALLFMGMWCNDCLFYVPCEHVDPEKLCWRRGNNPDAFFLRELFDRVARHTLVPGVRLDYSRMALHGYSVGAQMVSRCYNDFPLMTTSGGLPFPRLRAGVLLGGGSMHCCEC